MADASDSSLSVPSQQRQDSSRIPSFQELPLLAFSKSFASSNHNITFSVLQSTTRQPASTEETKNEKVAVCELGFSPSGCGGKGSDKGQSIRGEVGIVSNVEGKRETLDFATAELERLCFLKQDMGRSGIKESSGLRGKAPGDCGANEGKPTVEAQVANEDSGLENALEAKKKRLLEELESVLLPKDEFSGGKTQACKMVQQDLPLRPSLGIEVIDETALVETIPASGIGKKTSFLGSKKCIGKDAIKEMDVKNGKQSRRKAKGAKMVLGMDGRHASVTGTNEAHSGSGENGNGTKRKYSRKEMEALRLVNMVQQRKIWKAIYSALDTAVAKEYNNLASSEHQKHIRLNYDPHQCFAKKKESPAILSAVCCENMDNELQLMESSENVSLVDPSCSHGVMGEDECSNVEECSEDGDGEDDYGSIQRPAFLVEGEPNFDSGPPEDGWEYLRRVRWEAGQIPNVKVAKLDRSKLNMEQSDYMPKIPDIAKCPEHLLPLKQWEDEFLAEFSALRVNFSRLEGSNAINSSDLQTVRSSLLPGNDFGASGSVMKRDVLLYNHLSIGKAIDQPTILTAEDKDTSLPLENPRSKTSIDHTTSSPLLSSILGMDSVARVSMLQKQIRLLEPANTITRNDCLWLFALSATVDTPLDADTCAALRSLLRKCASIRAEKAELDEEVVMLNILATISGRCFGQSEN